MKCPFLEEIMMQYCTACEVKKMLPSNRLVTPSPCDSNYHECPVFIDFYENKKKRKMQDIIGKDEGSNAPEGSPQ